MKILAFTDLHADAVSFKIFENKILKSKPDIILCCGDISIFGYGLNEVAKRLNSFNIKTLIIPGNHETISEINFLCNKYKNLINLHENIFEFNDYTFFGFGTGGFSDIEPRLENIIKTFKKVKNLIFLTHAPIYNTKLDKINNQHLGCISSRKFIEKFNPQYVFCGHFHMNETKQDKINNSLIINPSTEGFLLEI